MSENIANRLGRLIAGLANDALDGAERANPRVILEQAVREIDAAMEELRAELGLVAVEGRRLDLRADELRAEGEGLGDKVALALRENREDLARVGLSRQIDIESQLALLDRAGSETRRRAGELAATMEAARASRREIEGRLADLSRIQAGAPQAQAAAQDRVSRAEAAVARASGAAAALGGPRDGADFAALEELDRLARERQVDERLARLRTGLLK